MIAEKLKQILKEQYEYDPVMRCHWDKSFKMTDLKTGKPVARSIRLCFWPFGITDESLIKRIENDL